MGSGTGTGSMSDQKTSNALRRALHGLSQEQRMKVIANLPEPRRYGTSYAGEESTRAGWSIYREPTTINPPTTLRLHKRSPTGKLLMVINITENGVTK
jgi:hypothetical protein